MRIGIDARELISAEPTTGIGRFLLNFLGHVIERRPDHFVFAYGNQHTRIRLDAPNLTIRTERERRTLWWDQVVLPRFAATDGLDLFLSPYAKGPYRVRCPLVITIHDLLLLSLPQYCTLRRWPRNWITRRVSARVARRASLILTVSEHTRRDITALFGVSEDKIEVVPNAVGPLYDPVTDSDAMEACWRRYEVEPPYILYVGNFKPHKNVESLLRAFACFSTSLREEYQLVLGGQADRWLDERRALAEDLGIHHQTRFIGAVAEKDLPALYTGASVFVFPSLYEGFGLPPLEAMACGTAVVASNRSSLPEVVGEAGRLVDPVDVPSLAEAIREVISDDRTRNDMESRGIDRAAAFRTDDICERQLQIVERVARETECRRLV